MKISIGYKIITALIFPFFSLVANAQTTNLPVDSVEKVKDRVKSLLLKPYLKDGICEKVTIFQNWQDVELDKCDYTVKEKNTGLIKHATVIVHVPTAAQLARWIVNTCIVVKGSASNKCTMGLISQITEQSGSQFPVAGVVFEDMDKDGFENTWNFRDGVTVVIENGIGNESQGQPTKEQIEASLTGKILKTGKYGYARIQGTTREEYLSSCKLDNNCVSDVKKIGATSERKVEWLNVVRQLYQAALGKDRNELMIAWARSNKITL